MMMGSGWLRQLGGVLAVLLFMVGGAFADEPDEADFHRAANRIARVAGGDALTRTCPADIWRARQTGPNRAAGRGGNWDIPACRADLTACAGRCIDGQHGESCGSLAHILETSGVPGMAMAGRRAYALACALGDPAGCTNRASGIRNVPMPEDALSQDATPQNAACQRRSFAVACAAGDAWGCAMEGQALRLGEGGPADPDAAGSRFRRACALSNLPEEGEDTALAPCAFARQQQEVLTRPR